MTWTDGPAKADVARICHTFSGAGFDGMTDYKSSKRHKYRGEVVHFGADFIFESRHMSDAAKAAARAAWDALSVSEQCDMFNRYHIRWDGDRDCKITDLGIEQFASLAASQLHPPKPSPTAAAVEFVSEH